MDLITQRSGGQVVPSTPGQRKEWQLHYRRNDTSFLNMSRAYRLGSRVDKAALSDAVQALISRHDALRTRLELREDQLVQVIECPNSPLVSGLSGDQETTGSTAAAWLARTTENGFDLARDVPVRVALFEERTGTQFVAIVMHHIISDNISMGIVLRDLSELLMARLDGRDARLPAVPLQFADYAAWYADQDKAGHFEPSYEYWVQALDGAPVRTPVPPTGDPEQHGAKSEVVDLGFPLRDLQRCARSLRTTPYVVLLALFSAALSTLTGADDQVFGCGYGSRPAAGLRDSVGRFVTQLPLRVRSSRRVRTSEAVASVHQVAMRAYANSVVALDAVVERGLLGECSTEIPFTNIAFQLLQQNVAGFALPGVDVQPVTAAGSVMRRDLVAAVMVDGQRLVTHVDYQPGLTSPASISDLIGDFHDRIAGLVRAQDARVN